MRASRDGSFIFQTKHDKLIGINLGADYVAEHEWGIEDINRMLGIDKESGVGLDRRKVTKDTPFLFWFEKTIAKKKYVGFAMYRFYEGVEEWSPRDGFYSTKDFHAGWSKDGFYCLTEADYKKSADYLKEIHDALKNKNACVWLGGGGVFQNSGLCIGIVDKMPQEIFKGWADSDNDQIALKAEFDATGIEKILRDAGKDWFYLGPKRNSEGKMIIWLNPREQDIHDSGYFTVKELKQWAHNTGPVMMSEADKKAY